MTVTAPRGFRAAGRSAGLKPSGRPDLALVVNDGPASVVAGVFTSNRVQAAPVLWSREVVRGGRVRAVLLNSGGANACTGPRGFQDAHASAESVAAELGIGAGEVALCSTGLIGVPLNMDALLAGIPKLVASLSGAGGDDAAQAILTTDRVPKTAVLDAAGYRIGAMVKGSGMLSPALATMLAVVTTDADIDSEGAARALHRATRRTFDRVDTDGCMSTNDTVLLLASAASGVRPDPDAFAAALQEVCADLCSQMVDDAEGATKRIVVEVVGAADEDAALEVARSIARSALVKCALHGEDPNWGRILAAAGTTSVHFDPLAVDISFNAVPVAVGGLGTAEHDRARAALRAREVTIQVDLHTGAARASLLTTDLSAAYVHENSAYST